MDNLNVVVALITRDNDYQAAQAACASEAAARTGVTLQIVYAQGDAVNQTQQLVKIIQDSAHRPHAILVEPVGTEMIQVAKAAVGAGIGWGVLNRDPAYISDLRRSSLAPSFIVTTDQEEVGRIQGEQINAIVGEGNILYIEGPFGGVAQARTRGMLSTKSARVEAKMLRADWTEQTAFRAIKSWLTLSTSRQLQVRAVVCQNDAMAMGARKALTELMEKDRDHWKNIPFTGCDGVPKTGQEWVRKGLLRATVITATSAGLAVELFAKAFRTGSMPPARTLLTPISFPEISQLAAKQARGASGVPVTA
jgi:ABC-type sugar transport system substrate-binding protein